LVVAFAVNACAASYFAYLAFPVVYPRPYTEMLSCAVVGAACAGLVTAYPLAKLFPSKSWVAGLVVASPVIALRGDELLHYSGTDQQSVHVMAVAEILVYTLAITSLAWFTSKRLVAAKGVHNALHRTAL
jgi:hypothetical protein